MKNKQNKKEGSDELRNRGDELNPTFMIQTTDTLLLSEALRGEFDINYILRKELAARGLNEFGNWIGFDAAKKLHKIN